MVGQALDAQILVQVGRHPGMQLDEVVVFGGLRQQRRAELRLAATALHEHHQLARGVDRDLVAEVGFDQRQRQVDPGRHAGGRPHGAVADEDPVRVDLDRRIGLLQPSSPFPMGGDAAAVELPGGGQQEGAGADRAQTPYAGSAPPYPGDQRRRRGVLVALAAARRDDGVDRQIVERCQRHRHDLQSRAGGDQTARLRGHAHLIQGSPRRAVAAAGREQGLHRPGEVEQVHVFVRQHHHPQRGIPSRHLS